MKLRKFFRKNKILVEPLKSEESDNSKSKFVKKEDDFSLYKTKFGDYFWLDDKSYVGKEIVNTGIWEQKSTEIIRKFVEEGDIVLDVGANFGYYSVIMSKLVGKNGQVLAFEPTTYFYNLLQKNIKENSIENCLSFQLGLSDSKREEEIIITEDTATMHDLENYDKGKKEKIKLDTLNNFIAEQGISRIDFVKIDIDGHEPFFFEGGWKILEKFNPFILLEVAHLRYLAAGWTAWDFYDLLKKKGYHIYSENNLEEIMDRNKFLIECGNFAYSSNILISKKEIDLSFKK